MSNNRRRRPPQSRPAPNALAAEATGGVLVFEFRDQAFEIDPADVDLAKAAAAINMMQRLPDLTGKMGTLLDTFEACLGRDNLTRLYALAPEVFSSADAQREFWEAFAKATVGGTAGESPAS